MNVHKLRLICEANILKHKELLWSDIKKKKELQVQVNALSLSEELHGKVG